MFDPSVNFTGFALFMSVAMSVTAFPVLARVLAERELLQTRVGSLAIACAAVNDVAAWLILAGIVVIVRSSSLPLPLWMTLAGFSAFVSIMYVAGGETRRAKSPGVL
jgi:Kef-type K+ transport system membrane component KefB